MTPEAVAGEVRPDAGAVPRLRGAGRGDLATTCPASRGRREDGREVDQPVRRPRQRRSTHADEVKGKAGDTLREHLGDVIAQPPAQRAGARRGARPRRPTDLARAAVGPAGGAHAVRQPGVPGAARPAVRDPGDVPRTEVDEPASRSTARCWRRASWPAGWREHATAGRRRRRAGARAAGGAGSGDVFALALASGDGAAAWFDADAARPGGRPGVRGAGSPTPSGPRSLHDAKGPMLALAARGWRLAGVDAATPRCRRTSPGPTSAPSTWPT